MLNPSPLPLDIRVTGRVVLVADDEELIRWSLGERLRQAGHSVLEAETGREVLGVIARREVDAVLLDVRLPDADGIELLRRIKARCPRISVVIITAHGTDELRQVACECGACAFVHKPFDVEQVASIVDKALSAG